MLKKILSAFLLLFILKDWIFLAQAVNNKEEVSEWERKFYNYSKKIENNVKKMDVKTAKAIETELFIFQKNFFEKYLWYWNKIYNGVWLDFLKPFISKNNKTVFIWNINLESKNSKESVNTNWNLSSNNNNKNLTWSITVSWKHLFDYNFDLKNIFPTVWYEVLYSYKNIKENDIKAIKDTNLLELFEDVILNKWKLEQDLDTAKFLESINYYNILNSDKFIELLKTEKIFVVYWQKRLKKSYWYLVAINPEFIKKLKEQHWIDLLTFLYSFISSNQELISYWENNWLNTIEKSSEIYKYKVVKKEKTDNINEDYKNTKKEKEVKTDITYIEFSRNTLITFLRKNFNNDIFILNKDIIKYKHDNSTYIYIYLKDNEMRWKLIDINEEAEVLFNFKNNYNNFYYSYDFKKNKRYGAWYFDNFKWIYNWKFKLWSSLYSIKGKKEQNKYWVQFNITNEKEKVEGTLLYKVE